jgi:hypothetical protein
VPSGPEGLTAEWLGEILRESTEGGSPVTQVTALQIGAGRGFVGKLFRCRLTYEAGGGPGTLVVKLSGPASPRRGLLERFGLFEQEEGFYRDLQADTPVRTPHCYFAGIDTDTGNFALVLEDMGSDSSGNPLVPATDGQVSQALDIAASMHSHWWNASSLSGLSWLASANAPRTGRYIKSHYDEAWAAFDLAAGQYLPRALRRLGAGLGEVLPTVLDHLSSPPVTLVHGDFQRANLFHSPDGRVLAVGDWQVVERSRGAIDIAHFLVNSLEPAERKRTERDALQKYHESLILAGIDGYSREELWIDYRLAVLKQFGQAVVRSHALNQVAEEDSSHEDRELAAVAGARLIAALAHLRPQDILEDRPLWRRVAAVLSRPFAS